MTAENLTFLDVVNDVAADYGRTVTEDEARFILLEHTGYPSFWPTGRPVDDCVNQVNAFFRDGPKRLGYPLDEGRSNG